jgi:ribokinase
VHEMDVLVVGALHHDVIVNAPRMPELDETLNGQSVAYALGGKGGNQALSAARHGARTAFAGSIGNDEAGRSMKEQLASGGVDVAQIATHETLASGMSVAIVTANGDYGAVIVSAANEAIDAANIAIPKGLKWLILQNEVLPDINLAVAKKAKQSGAKVMLNAAPARDLDSKLMELVDVLIVNRVEAKAIGKVELNTQATVIETRGGDGLSLLLPNKASEFLPAFKVPVISSHGAGDCFVGALAARLCASDTIENAALYASAAAALHVSSSAETRATITQHDVFKLMETRHAYWH